MRATAATRTVTRTCARSTATSMTSRRQASSRCYATPICTSSRCARSLTHQQGSRESASTPPWPPSTTATGSASTPLRVGLICMSTARWPTPARRPTWAVAQPSGPSARPGDRLPRRLVADHLVRRAVGHKYGGQRVARPAVGRNGPARADHPGQHGRARPARRHAAARRT